MSEQTRQLAERIARDLFTSEKNSWNLRHAADCIEKHLAEAAGASVPQEAALLEALESTRRHLCSELDSGFQLPQARHIVEHVIDQIIDPALERAARLTGEASSAPQDG